MVQDKDIVTVEYWDLRALLNSVISNYLEWPWVT